ncbi:MAG: T9SS type A sorting domain-containing protein [Bacteroidota bacterium]
MRILDLIILCLVAEFGFGQVKSVDYKMQYNCETDAYVVSLVILEGSATSEQERVQFNSQISLVVPTGNIVEITDLYMPLESNQNYNSLIPMKWNVTNPVISPEAQPESDFYSVLPSITPLSYYNDIDEGDEIKLFSFIAGESKMYDERVRFFDNGIDPPSHAPGMFGGNFTNGFTLGSGIQIYNGHVEEFCLTNIEEELSHIFHVYPNPFANHLTLELPSTTKKIEIIASNGKVFFEEEIDSSNPIIIDTHDFPSGVYFARMHSSNEIVIQKVVK